jgi:hypothetical protein
MTSVVAALLFALPAHVSAGQALGGVVLQDVRPRIITPNGDARNDSVVFQFDTSLAGVPIQADILDLDGRRVAGMEMSTSGPDPDSQLTWNGRDDSGRIMPSGIYIYSIKIGQKAATGTVVVAR